MHIAALVAFVGHTFWTGFYVLPGIHNLIKQREREREREREIEREREREKERERENEHERRKQ